VQTKVIISVRNVTLRRLLGTLTDVNKRLKVRNVSSTKACSKCGIVKENTIKFFPPREGSKLRADCRDCYNKFRNNSPVYLKNQMLIDAKRRASSKGLDFDLNKELHFPEVCPVLGIPIKHGSDSWFNSPNIDRIDNSKGYTMDNVIVVSALANSIKSSATPRQIIQVGKFYDTLYKEKGIEHETLQSR